MATILIVESNPFEGPRSAGFFTESIEIVDPTLQTRVIAPYDGPVDDAMLSDVDGAIFTGSAVEWGVDAPQAAPLRAVMERIFAARIPSYGSCNGMQMAAFVLGGASGPSGNGQEAGLAQAVALTDAGTRHPFLAGRRSGFAAPCIHLHEVTRLPEGAVLLAGNSHSPVQAFAYEQAGVRFWGVQYHPEMSPACLAGILAEQGGHGAATLADLRHAETDAEAARRLGAAPEDVTPEGRLTEIRNWLASLSA
ncbi:type 1 glutamine amidotransferase [Nioella nitratireducens]|uniref:type 1 glutamine amidotransferase n=1 Tax=Nioella nitratireducens TaxID=1287720 RepID=UPI0008FD173B|nr:type 1 glutamine amidotransferase [Nioella nitratireducens]